ncbi:hypothetical protein [Halorhabdus amylolytica]|uniref:hypothetical protein n=1 Tax=Halorhabdus amylolytica TaxID=2559573 RepID=UPI0010AA11EF|nr:hypothetical protein [Halorhabdus amylolytica]
MSLRRSALNRTFDRHREVIEFGVTFVVLATMPLLDLIAPEIAFHAQNLVPSWLPGPSQGTVVGRSWFWLAVGMVVVGAGYAAVDDLPIRITLPGRDDVGTASVAVVGPLLVAAGYFLVVQAIGTSVADAGSWAAIPDLSLGFLWWNAVVPGTLVGLGYGVLFYGAIWGGLRETFESREVWLAITALAGLYHWFVDPIWRLARSNALLVIALVFVVGTTLAVVELSRMRDAVSIRDAVSPTSAVALVFAIFLSFTVAVDVLSGATTAGELLTAGTWFVVFAIAAWGHERTRSVWIPVVTIALFQMTILVFPHLEATAGLVATGP